jgi:hypothetical protein
MTEQLEDRFLPLLTEFFKAERITVMLQITEVCCHPLQMDYGSVRGSTELQMARNNGWIDFMIQEVTAAALQ